MVAEQHLSSSFWVLSSHSPALLLCSCKWMCRVFILTSSLAIKPRLSHPTQSRHVRLWGLANPAFIGEAARRSGRLHAAGSGLPQPPRHHPALSYQGLIWCGQHQLPGCGERQKLPRASLANSKTVRAPGTGSSVRGAGSYRWKRVNMEHE